MATALENIQRERGVTGGEPGPVVKSGLRPNREAIDQTIGGNRHRFRCKAIHRIGLVARTRHQRRKCQAHALRAIAFHHEGVERVEGLERLIVGTPGRDGRKEPSLGRADIDVVKLMKVRWIFQIAERRHAVGFGAGIARRRAPKLRCAERTDAESKYMSAGKLRHARKIPQDRLPILAAFSASNHHNAGKPDKPYFGNSGGRPKRSQRAVRSFG